MGRVRSPSMAESVRMTTRSVRNRLGRMVVTWLGIALGISFLMSALVTSDIRIALEEVSARRNDIENMFGTLRAEIGATDGKTIVVVVPQPEVDDALLDGLMSWVTERAEGLTIIGPVAAAEATARADIATGASAIIACEPAGWGGGAPWEAWLAPAVQRVVLVYGEGDLQRLESAGVRVRPIMPPLSDEERAMGEKEILDRKIRRQWLVGVSLLVAAIGISNALLMSVTERYREIGTMKCLGALDRFIIRLVLMESGFLGGTGAAMGIVLGVVFAVAGYSGTYGLDVVLDALDGGRVLSGGLKCFAVGWVVAVIAAVYPAFIAARMVPADALRTDI